MRPHAREAAALALLAVTLAVMVVGPLYYNSTLVAAKDRGQGQVFYVTAKQWTFTPDKFVVKQGERVTFYVTSSDVVHGFSVKGYDVGVMVYPGDYSELSFIANMTGTFEIICFVNCGTPSVGSGEGHSMMNATLTVTPS